MDRSIILVAIPTMGSVRTELEQRLDEYKDSVNPSITVRRVSNVQDHAAARNHLVLYHFDPDCYTHLLFIDADVVPPSRFLERMLAVRQPVVSAVTHVWRPRKGQRQPEPALALWQRKQQTDDTDTYDRVEIIDRNQSVSFKGLATGSFCLLVESWVFNKLRDTCGLPWFKTTYQHETQEKLYSEDLYFMRNLEKIGVAPYVMPDIMCDHFKTVSLADVELYGRAMYEKGRELTMKESELLAGARNGD